MTKYAAGRRQEYRVKKMLEEAGAVVLRSAGSKGPADLVAIFPAEVVAVQVKKAKPTSAEIKALKEASAKSTCLWAMVWSVGKTLEVTCFEAGRPSSRNLGLQ